MAKQMINKNILKTLGPGIMFAGTCIGGSHLVQSTRAGADYGFGLLVVILLANFFKYPFFEFASRYTNATGKSILVGFKKEGKWTLYAYGAITLLSMFIVTGAIIYVTGGLLGNLFKIESINTLYWVLAVAGVTWGILAIGKFSLLDSTLKIVGVVLVVSVLAATLMLLMNGRPDPVVGFVPKPINDHASLLFIIGLMGWMPTGVDMSAWASIWTEERIKQTGYHPTLKETLLDFNIGYGITILMAICFLCLGAYVFYGSGQTLPNDATSFSDKLVNLFTSSIGAWSYPLIAAATFSTMFGTSLTLVDGYARSMAEVTSLMALKNKPTTHRSYLGWSFGTLAGGFLVVFLSTQAKTDQLAAFFSFKGLMDLATGISFFIAPLAAYLNHRIVFNKNFPSSHTPPKWLKILSISGILFLSAVTITYVLSNFFDFFSK